MGSFGIWLFGEKDTAIVEEIAKVHKLEIEKVKEAYENMLKELKNETQE